MTGGGQGLGKPCLLRNNCWQSFLLKVVSELPKHQSIKKYEREGGKSLKDPPLKVQIMFKRDAGKRTAIGSAVWED